MYKRRVYNDDSQVMHIDGNFSGAIIKKFTTEGRYSHKTLYFMVGDVMYSTDEVENDLSGFERDLFLKYSVKSYIENYGYSYKPCSTFKEDYIAMRKNRRICNVIEVGTENAVLTEYKNGYIHVQSCTNEKLGSEIMLYDAGCFLYGSTRERMEFEGFPDMDDSSHEMNVLMVMCSIQRMRDCGELFKEYMKHRDVQY